VTNTLGMDMEKAKARVDTQQARGEAGEKLGYTSLINGQDVRES